MEYQFDYSQKMIKGLISAFNNGLARARDSANETEGFSNAIGMGKYRYIYHSMYSSKIDGLLPIKLNINSWDFTVFYHQESSTMFGLMSKVNFELKRKNPPEILHYMAANSEFFNVIENDFESLLDESQKVDLQLSFKMDQNDQVDEVIKSIYKGTDFDLNKVDKFVLLVADFMRNEVVDLQAVVINGNFDTLYSEDWSKHIVISAQDQNDMVNKHEESPQHRMKLNLRKNILPKKTDEES